MNLGIGTVCTVQGLVDNVGSWGRSDFIDLARRLDDAHDSAESARILMRIFSSFKYPSLF